MKTDFYQLVPMQVLYLIILFVIMFIESLAYLLLG
uniref:Riboflavin synthase alpha chain n=1 Tax=Arundo donax TaxID=35708 RepID=A0A0A9EIZ8_ARUDO